MTSVRLCAADDVKVEAPQRFEIEGQAVCVVRDSAGELYALGDRCSHGDISLAEGFVEDDSIECWAHGSQFSLKTGWPRTLPAYEPVPVYRIQVQEGDIYIDPTPIFEEKS
ncbi:non-heme iron oxygenase ferredoxin subunit [Pseudoclavibacter helvolus]|uniref:non-heme iron oxygenase ferredoxin subunit n=1 Tax=Pseudoclavibacter helvolus TaxID=255205 RepID=UPI003C768BD8